MPSRTTASLFWIALAIFELFLLTLPLLPNGDGPVHIYLSSIFRELAAHTSPLYASFYAIRHLVQPYSFHYYLLIALERFTTPDTAEKLFAGLIWATLALGFRALTRALAPGNSLAPLLIFAFLFSWPLSAGFFNFTFAAGLLLLALAFYLTQRLSALVLTLLLLVLAHPIPLMVLIAVTGLDLLFQLSCRQALPRRQVIAFALACLAFIFPVLIADKAAVAGSMRTIHFDPLLLRNMLTGIDVSCFQVHSVLGWTYQALIASVLPLTVFFFVRSAPRKHPLTPAGRLLLATLLFLLVSLFFPESMNGSAFFAVRMWFLVWLLLASCLPAFLPSPALQRAAAAAALAAAGLSLAFAGTYLRPLARRQAALEQAPLPPHARGLFIQAPSGGYGILTHTWWGLDFWDGVRAFSAHGDVLVNTPWLQLTIVPVQENGRAGLLRDRTPNLWSENPTWLLREITPENRAPILALADFLLLADPGGAPPRPLTLASTVLGPLAGRWQCQARDFYAVCKRK